MMDLTQEEIKLVIEEVLIKLNYGKSYKKYRDLEKGAAIWRRSYLRTYKDNSPSHERSRDQKYYLGLVFRSIEQFTADCKDALFSNDPFFNIRPRGGDQNSDIVAEAVQAVLTYNLTEPIDYSMSFLQAYRQACVFGVAYMAPFYDYKQMYKTDYTVNIDPVTGQKRVGITDEMYAECDHPDFDIIYPTRVVCDPNAKFGRFAQSCNWRIIERIRPSVWYTDKQEIYGFNQKTKTDIKNASGSTRMETVGPDNFSDNWNLQCSKQHNELEYIGRIDNPKLRGKFDQKRRYIVTVIDQTVLIRCDISAAPDGIGLHCMNIVPDLDGSHIGIGIADPALDYQKAINEWYNLRMRGLAMAINPAYLVDETSLPNWKQMEGHPPGKLFPYQGGADARKVIQALMPQDVSGATWEQMVGFTQRDHDLTVGTSASRLGSIEGQTRTATELSQVKEGADRRSNDLIYHAVRTGHKPTLWSMAMYTMKYWSTPRTLTLVNQKTQQQNQVLITPDDIREAKVNLDIVDATGGSMDQQMAFYSKLYELSLQDPTLNHTAVLVNMLKNSKIVKDPYSLLQVMPQGELSPSMEQGGGQVVNDAAYDKINKGTNSTVQRSTDFSPTMRASRPVGQR